jgi:hypothetical protein
MDDDKKSEQAQFDQVQDRLDGLERKLKAEVELSVYLRDIERKLEFAEGRRSGINYVIGIMAVVVTILLGAGIFTLWTNLRNSQEVSFQEFQTLLQANLEANLQTRAHNADVEAQTREAAIELSVNSTVEALLTTVEAELVTQQAIIQESGNQGVDQFATRADQRVIDFATRTDERFLEVSDRANLLNEEVATRVFTAVEANIDPAQLQAVAAEILQTRIGNVIEESFEESVQLAVDATSTAIATQTPIGTPSATPTPTP